jgi:hypothetical protein
MNRIAVFGFLFAATATGACGSLGNSKSQPVLATVHGELTNPQSLTPSPATRVAVVWLVAGDGSYRVAEDLPVQPVFPAQFTLSLTSAPPSAVMLNDPKVSADLSWAVGAIVAYDDLNGNGRLDLVDKGATAYVDRILGANDQVVLSYFEGTLTKELADPSGHMPTLGFNLFAFPTGSAPGAWLPIDTPYTLPITANPRFSEIMCSNGKGFGGLFGQPEPEPTGGSEGAQTDGGTTPLHDAGPPPPADPNLPSPTDPKLECAPDGKSFTYDCKPSQPSLCGGDAEQGCGAMPMPVPPPPNWPCPVH